VLVVDASVSVKWIIDEPQSAEARKLLLGGATENGARQALLAPALLLIEAHYAIAKRYMRGEATDEQLSRTIPALIDVFGNVAPLDRELAEAAAEISLMAGNRPVPRPAQPFGVYDCVYIALARRERAALVTADRRQAEIARAVNVAVQVL
jgi:predicted nucleic acid-binding protein